MPRARASDRRPAGIWRSNSVYEIDLTNFGWVWWRSTENQGGEAVAMAEEGWRWRGAFASLFGEDRRRRGSRLH